MKFHKLLDFYKGLRVTCIFVIFVLYLSLCSANVRRNKPYLNEFFFKLADDSNIDIVRERAKGLDFIWLKKVIPKLHLFRKQDLPDNTANAVPDKQIDKWLNAFGNLVAYIEQEKFTQVYTTVEAAQPAAYQESPASYTDWSEWSVTKHEQRHYRSTDQTEKTLEMTTLKQVPKQRTLVGKVLKAGSTTKPIIIAVLDAFFDTDHRNLQGSIIKDKGYNFVDGNTNLQPREFLDDFYEEHYPEDGHLYSHGTKCMGRIASSAEFGCNIGGDVSAKIIALKFIDEHGFRKDVDEIAALEYRNDEIDIYSCSYGARDNYGFSTSKFRAPIEDALAEGVHKGRQCKGSIYLFPSGNGNGKGRLDNCNTDVYSSSINTITIASITMSYKISEETETCPCALVATFGSPAPELNLFMNTTKPRNQCTFHFRGTSAATAYAAGLISHVLRENPYLSKRDIEHLLVYTANTDLDPSVKWKQNGAKLKYNDRIGFGAIDLDTMIHEAKAWKHVPEKHICVIEMKDGIGGFSSGKMFTTEYKISSNGCHGNPNHVQYLEHVQLEVELSCSNISNIVINLVSPMKTRVGLLTKITLKDQRRAKLDETLKWTFMAVQFWGENPEGNWTVELIANGTDTVTTNLLIKKLILHGTKKHPREGESVPRNCEVKMVASSKITSKFLLSAVLPITTAIIATAISVIFLLYCLCWRNENFKSWKNKKIAKWKKKDSRAQGVHAASEEKKQETFSLLDSTGSRISQSEGKSPDNKQPDVIDTNDDLASVQVTFDNEAGTKVTYDNKLATDGISREIAFDN